MIRMEKETDGGCETGKMRRTGRKMEKERTIDAMERNEREGERLKGEIGRD